MDFFCCDIYSRCISVAQQWLTQALERKILISEVASLAKCLAKVERSRLTGTQGGWERRMPIGIWWVTGRSKLTRSSLGVGIAMWRGSTLMVEEPVWSNILSLGSTGRSQMGTKGRGTECWWAASWRKSRVSSWSVEEHFFQLQSGGTSDQS